MQKKLGYRFELVDSKVENNILTIHIKNNGYASVFKNREAFIIFRNISTNIEYSFPLDGNLKSWRDIYTINRLLSTYSLPNGQYKLFLHLPDPLNNDVRYCIQTANVGLWDSVKGYNDLQQTIIVNLLSIDDFIRNPPISNYTSYIYDLSGRLVTQSLSLNNLSAGIYIIKIIYNNSILTKKIIIN